MCIVIDTNSLSSVFNTENVRHVDFVPLKRWIIEGEGFIVYGGTKYKKELSRTKRYLRLFRLLKDKRRVSEIDASKVDAEHAGINLKTKGTDCNDQHIIAIFIASGCRLFCSVDIHADKYIKDRTLYPKQHPRPLIYRGLNQQNLLCRKYIVKLRHVI